MRFVSKAEQWRDTPVGRLVRGWRDELAARLDGAEVAVALYRWTTVRLWVWPPRAWWPWGFDGGIRHPLSGWLVPFEAYGGAPWSCLLATEWGHGEGFPGLVWSRGRHHGEQLHRHLPEPDADDYAWRYGLPREWIERRRVRQGWVLPRSQYGFVVEQGGRAWGVLVVECSSLGLEADPALRRSAVSLARDLERALEAGN